MKLIRGLLFSLLIVGSFLPFIAWAEDPTTPTNFQALVTLIINTILEPLVLLIIAGAVVMFLWGLVQYISKGGEGGKEAVSLMFWGIVIIFVMVSVWGLVRVLTGTFNFSNTPINPPTATFPLR